ncbi:RrF2 family transcriptional regulator [Tsukamurella soli]
MELPSTVEWGMHCCWLLAQTPPDSPLPRRRLAEFYGLPEPYLAKALKALVNAGILVATTGPRGGYLLARPAEKITALDVVIAVDGDTEMFRCTEIRQRGPVGLSPGQCRRSCGIASLMHNAETAWRNELAATTIADLLTSSAMGSRSRATKWLGTLAARS